MELAAAPVSAPIARGKSRMFPGIDQPSKKPCLFQPTTSPSGVEWYQPSSGWFNVIAPPPPPRPLKRGRDSMDDLTASMKRLRTDSEAEEDKTYKSESKEDSKPSEVKEPMSTALVVAKPPPRCRIVQPRLPPAPDYSLPPPIGSFPLVLYKGPPSPTVGPQPRKTPTRAWEDLSLLSKENRTLKVSPSMTIELVDDDEDETLPQSLAGAVDETIPRPGPSMSDDD